MHNINHVAFIMDGNRRFAKRLLKEPWKGHEIGAQKFSEVLNWLKEFGIREATFYAFSTENFNRPKQEFDFLMEEFKKNVDIVLKEPSVHEEGIRFTVIGELERFPHDVQKSARALMEGTKQYANYIVNLAWGYGGRQEIVKATQRIARAVAQGKLSPETITAQTFSQELDLQSEPDLIIRTGGDHRTSNFLMWQSAYSEWHFTPKFWPDFEKTDFEKALDDFAARNRRFGH